MKCCLGPHVELDFQLSQAVAEQPPKYTQNTKFQEVFGCLGHITGWYNSLMYLPGRKIMLCVSLLSLPKPMVFLVGEEELTVIKICHCNSHHEDGHM